MRIIKRISFTILALMVCAQIGLFGTPQAYQSNTNSQKTVQNVLLALPSVAEANAPMHCTFKNNGDVAGIIGYMNEGNKKTARIQPGANNYIFVDQGTSIILQVYGSSQSYDSMVAGQYEFSDAYNLTLDKAY